MSKLYLKVGPVIDSFDSESGIFIYKIDSIDRGYSFLMSKGLNELDLRDAVGEELPFKIELILQFDGGMESNAFSIINYLLNRYSSGLICDSPGTILNVIHSTSAYLLLCHPFFLSKELQVFKSENETIALLGAILISNLDIEFINDFGLDKFYESYLESNREPKRWDY